MTLIARIGKFAFVSAATTLFLVGCGGGGSSDSNSAPSSVASSIDQFTGTWKGTGCYRSTAQNIGTGSYTYVQPTMVISKLSDNTANVRTEARHFDNPQCINTPVLTFVRTGDSLGSYSMSSSGITSSYGQNVLAYTDAQTIDASPAYRLTMQWTALMAGISSPSVTINGYSVPTNSLGSGSSYWLARINASTLEVAENSSNYPTTFSTPLTLSYIKQ